MINKRYWQCPLCKSLINKTTPIEFLFDKEELAAQNFVKCPNCKGKIAETDWCNGKFDKKEKAKPKGNLILVRMKDINLPLTYENMAWFHVCHKIGDNYGLDLIEEEIKMWDKEAEA